MLDMTMRNTVSYIGVLLDMECRVMLGAIVLTK